MKWRKGGKKGAKNGRPRPGHSHLPFFVPFFAPFFFFFCISPELHVGPHFFRCSTFFVLLIEKGKKNRAKNEENGEKGEKGR
jgi:hypothetical protein